MSSNAAPIGCTGDCPAVISSCEALNAPQNTWRLPFRSLTRLAVESRLARCIAFQAQPPVAQGAPWPCPGGYW